MTDQDAILFRPRYPDSYPANPPAKAQALVALWKATFPEAQPADVDLEDWAENAIILQSLTALGVTFTILPPTPAYHVHGGNWIPRSNPGGPRAVMCGIWKNADFIHGLPGGFDPVGSDEISTRAALQYHASHTFRAHAGRRIVAAGAEEIGKCVKQLCDDLGHGRIFIKSIEKGFAIKLNLDLERPLWAQIVDQEPDLEWLPVQYEGVTKPLVLIQEQISCQFEYRMMIVQGQPVTGAGCIESMTPLDNEDLFDPKVEEVRNSGIVVRRPGLINRYLDFAKRYAAEHAAEHGALLDYSLDLCLDAQDDIVVIEINPPLNLGLYASNAQAKVAAMIAHLAMEEV